MTKPGHLWEELLIDTYTKFIACPDRRIFYPAFFEIKCPYLEKMEKWPIADYIYNCNASTVRASEKI